MKCQQDKLSTLFSVAHSAHDYEWAEITLRNPATRQMGGAKMAQRNTFSTTSKSRREQYCINIFWSHSFPTINRQWTLHTRAIFDSSMPDLRMLWRQPSFICPNQQSMCNTSRELGFQWLMPPRSSPGNKHHMHRTCHILEFWRMIYTLQGNVVEPFKLPEFQHSLCLDPPAARALSRMSLTTHYPPFLQRHWPSMRTVCILFPMLLSRASTPFLRRSLKGIWL